MTVRDGRSRSSKVGQGSFLRGRKGQDVGDDRGPGWGLGSGENGEDEFLRRALFAVLVAVVACVGGWFTLTTLSGRGGEKPLLSANDQRPAPAMVHTVRLADFPASNRDRATLLVSLASKKSLAPESEFHLVQLADGRMALCVGHFDDIDATSLRRLLRAFQEYEEGGSRPFATAAVYSYPR